MFIFNHRNPEMKLDKHHRASVRTDNRNEFLAESGSCILKANKAAKFSVVGHENLVTRETFMGSGDDYSERHKKYQNGKTANTSPQKGASARTNE
ncbi:hypothetical protein [Paraburkholderia sp. 32]|uniref:hypothetical protein n=1 Tax=Paraburkholderia sp. 32 TaxID=2991057 RepID=UPI003D2232D4